MADKPHSKQELKEDHFVEWILKPPIMCAPGHSSLSPGPGGGGADWRRRLGIKHPGRLCIEAAALLGEAMIADDNNQTDGHRLAEQVLKDHTGTLRLPRRYSRQPLPRPGRYGDSQKFYGAI